MHDSARPNWPNGLGLLAIHVAALAALLPIFFSWQAVAVAAVIAYLTGALGVTLNYHRTLTHRSLRLLRPVEYVTALLGELAFQGSPIDWVATHRIHHANSDHDGDPHTVTRGVSWAHFLWLFRTNPAMPNEAEKARTVPDLYNNRFYRALRVLNIPLQALLAVALFAWGGWSFVVWGVFARLVFTYHTTWFVNSAAHSAGYRTYKTGDRSTNSWWVALLSFGEGWHNNHHAFPYSARHGMAWWEIDVTWWTVQVLRALKLADKVRVPTPVVQKRLRLRPE